MPIIIHVRDEIKLKAVAFDSKPPRNSELLPMNFSPSLSALQLKRPDLGSVGPVQFLHDQTCHFLRDTPR